MMAIPNAIFKDREALVSVRAQVGRRLRAKRRLQGLSQRELSRHVGVSASALSGYELGKTWPTIDTLCALARALDVSLDALFADVELPDRRH